MSIGSGGLIAVNWNPASLSYLAELILGVFLSACAFGAPTFRGDRRASDATAALLGATFACVSVSIACSLLRAQVGGFYASYAMPWAPESSPFTLLMPWSSAFGGGALLAFVQFAYRFPADLPRSGRERGLVAAVMACFVALEAVIAVYSDRAELRNDIWFRSGVTSAWMAVATLWALLVFLRQFTAAQRAAGRSRQQGFIRELFARGLTREAAAARAYMLFLLLPLAHIAALVLKTHGPLRQVPLDAFSCWSVLALLASFSVIHSSYQAEQSSFMLKMITVSLALILGVISGFGWVIGPAYTADYRPPAMVQAGQTLRFSPDGRGGYSVLKTAFALEPATGTPISRASGVVRLPFAFPFYGKRYTTLFTSEDGVVGLDHRPRWIERAFGYGGQPLIAPLSIDLGADTRPTSPSEDVLARVEADRVVISWLGFVQANRPDERYSFQLVLFANGVAEMSYVALPQRPIYELFFPQAAPWFVGVTPGAGARVHWMNLDSGLTARAPPGQALIQDYYLGFLRHLNRLYAPIATLMLAATIAVAAGLPLFFRVNLIHPLGKLVEGVNRFHRGEFSTQVPVTYNDEIGYLTRSFNAMASSMHGLVNGLEDMVSERVEEVSRFAARNALLEERNRLAAELHDSVSQTLTSAALLADTLPVSLARDPELSAATVEQIKNLNRHALEEIRLLMTDLYANRLAAQPLAPALAGLEREFSRQHGLRIESDIRGEAKLPSDVQAMIYRIAQEALSNVARHANADQVTLDFEALPGQALLTITDNGRGFDPDAIPAGHLGLQVMSYRARHVGASLEVNTRPGGGTTITLVWISNVRH